MIIPKALVIDCTVSGRLLWESQVKMHGLDWLEAPRLLCISGFYLSMETSSILIKTHDRGHALWRGACMQEGGARACRVLDA